MIDKNILGLFILIAVTLFIVLFIKTIISTIKIRRQAREMISQKRSAYPTACAGSPTIDIPPTANSLPVEYIQFKDKEGKIVNPNDYNIFIAKGESMQFAEIHNNYMIFAIKKQSIDFPKVVVIHSESETSNQTQYKIRRCWRICNVIDAKSIVEKTIKSKDFDLIRNLQPYDNDNLLLEDFVQKRLKRYIDQHPFCDDENDKYHEVIISTTFHTDKCPDPEDRGKIRFSIHPTSLLIGEVVYSFPM